MACLIVFIQDLNNCSLERRACSTHSAISSYKMEWDCLFIFRMGYRSVLLTKYHRLPETYWATSSFSFLISTQSIAPQALCSHSVPVALLKCMHYVLLRLNSEREVDFCGQKQSPKYAQRQTVINYLSQHTLKGTAF